MLSFDDVLLERIESDPVAVFDQDGTEGVVRKPYCIGRCFDMASPAISISFGLRNRLDVSATYLYVHVGRPSLDDR
ncbi:hypothetical protein [Halopiger xanaduensis]|uniref:hypothetical protein n=1 Tax=Halopiger xanaduensis TaxID=387343 RepID=UPI001FE11AEE|nr:hypothetical protein [Halopiger xanaduensis]